MVKNHITLALQIATAKAIAKDAKGDEFTLSRVGEGDQFEGDFAQNYQYLLWREGNEPVSKASINYTITESANSTTITKTLE